MDSAGNEQPNFLELRNLQPQWNVKSPDGKFWGTVSKIEEDGITISWCTIDGKNLPEDRELKYGFDAELELVLVPWRDSMPRDRRLPNATPHSLDETQQSEAPDGVIGWLRKRLGI